MRLKAGTTADTVGLMYRKVSGVTATNTVAMGNTNAPIHTVQALITSHVVSLPSSIGLVLLSLLYRQKQQTALSHIANRKQNVGVCQKDVSHTSDACAPMNTFCVCTRSVN